MGERARLAVIGGGRMGRAIAEGLLASGAYSSSELVVAEPDSATAAELSAGLGVECLPDAAAVAGGADTVILAVKPQVIDDVARSISPALREHSLVISIAAGVSCARLESLLPPGTAVVRVMPNTPAMVGQAMSVVSGGQEASAADVERTRELFGHLGKAVVLEERHQDTATAISGSGPAYVALFVDALARAGVRHGLTREAAQTLAVQTLKGTAELLERTGQHPEQLVDTVSSPGGTTAAATEALEGRGFRSAIFAAVSAAVGRAKELAG